MKIDFTIRECPEFLLEVLPQLVSILGDKESLYYEPQEHAKIIGRLLDVLADEFSDMIIDEPKHERMVVLNVFLERTSKALVNCKKEIHSALEEDKEKGRIIMDRK